MILCLGYVIENKNKFKQLTGMENMNNTSKVYLLKHGSKDGLMASVFSKKKRKGNSFLLLSGEEIN